MNIKRIRLTRFEREDNFDFNMIRGVNQLLFTSITDQQCRMSFNRPWTISIYCRITLINVEGFLLIFTTVLHPSTLLHHPIHHCFAPLPTPPSYSQLFCTPPHPTILFTSVLHPSPPHHPIHHCFALLPTSPSYSPLFCTPPHPTILFTTVLHPSPPHHPIRHCFVPLQHPHHPFSTDQCPAGKFSADGSGPLCRVCPKDTYQDQPGETACKNCEHGTKTLQLAATSAEACGGKRLIHLDQCTRE